MQLTITLPDNGRAEHVSLETLPFARSSIAVTVSSPDERAAVEEGLGFARGDEWSVADFNADKEADIERENARDFA